MHSGSEACKPLASVRPGSRNGFIPQTAGYCDITTPAHIIRMGTHRCYVNRCDVFPVLPEIA